MPIFCQKANDLFKIVVIATKCAFFQSIVSTPINIIYYI